MKMIREYFLIDKRQERGLLVLIIIIFIVIVFNHFAPKLLSENKETLVESMVYVNKIAVYHPDNNKEKKERKIEIQPVILNFSKQFDPNTVSIETLKNANLPSFVADNWIKYLKYGASFKKPEDVSRVYGMNENLYNQLEKWIKIEPQLKPDIDLKKERSPITETPVEMKETTLVILGINSADSAQLLEVSGIGPFYAGAIVKYRNRLGGYRSMNQLMELYKMDSGKLEKMLPQLYLDSIAISRIPINQIEFKELLKHPYIDYETTKYILNKRQKLGKFAALYELKDSVNMPDSLYQKILPYIKLEN
jgi:DNA uptake protein ComE-like DNA-binding protein